MTTEYTREQLLAAGKRAKADGNIDAVNEIADQIAAMDASASATSTPPTQQPTAPSVQQVPRTGAEELRQKVSQLTGDSQGGFVDASGAVINSLIRGGERAVANVAEFSNLGFEGNTPEKVLTQGFHFGFDQPRTEFGEMLDQWGRVGSPEEQAQVSRSPLLSSFAQEAPGLVFSGGKAQEGARFFSKVLRDGVESAIQGQLTDDSEDSVSQMERMRNDGLVGGAFRAILDTASGVTGKVKKFLPKTQGEAYRQALSSVNSWTRKPAEFIEERLEKARELFGDEAEYFGLADILPATDAKRLRNIEAKLASTADPDLPGGGDIIDKVSVRQAKREEAVHKYFNRFQDTLRLSDEEADLVTRAYQNLDTIWVDPDRYKGISENKKFQEMMREIYSAKKGPLVDVRDELAMFDNFQSVGFLDTFKQHVQDKLYRGRLGYEPDWSGATERKLAELQKLLLNATEKSAGKNSDYIIAKSLAQRRILSRQIDDQIKRAAQEGSDLGEMEIALTGIRNVLTKKNWVNIKDALTKANDKEATEAALRNARLVRDMLPAVVEGRKITNRLGEGFEPRTDLQGLLTTALKEAGDISRADVTTGFLEILHNPAKHTKALEKIQKAGNKEEAYRRLLRYLATVTTNYNEQDERRDQFYRRQQRQQQ